MSRALFGILFESELLCDPQSEKRHADTHNKPKNALHQLKRLRDWTLLLAHGQQRFQFCASSMGDAGNADLRDLSGGPTNNRTLDQSAGFKLTIPGEWGYLSGVSSMQRDWAVSNPLQNLQRNIISHVEQ